jgi:tetratricopeptide (TPR) repeat protein
MKITRKTALGITLIVLIGLTSWGLAGALEEQQYIDQGKAEYNRDNYDAAIYLFNKAVDLNPDNEYLYNDLGLCYVALGDIDLAIPEFSKAIELNSDCVEAYYNRGLAYFGQGRRAGNLPNAISDFTKAIELEPVNVDAYYNRGLTYNQHYNRGKNYDKEDTTDYYTKAVADFDKVLELDPTYVLAYAGKGNAGYRNKKYDTAEENFVKALESESAILEKSGGKGLAGVYASRARNLKAMCDYHASIASYNMAMNYDPELSTAIGHQASNYQIVCEWDNLIELCDYHLDLKKGDPAWLTKSHGGYTKYAAKGLAYYNLGQYDEAIANYNRVIELRPTVGAYRGLGIAYSEIGASENATEAFDKALEMDTSIIEEGTYTRMYSKYYSRGLTYYAMQEYDKAISDFDKAIELKSDYAGAYRDLGKAYVEIGDKTKANEAFKTAISLFEEQGNEYAAGQVKELLSEL